MELGQPVAGKRGRGVWSFVEVDEHCHALLGQLAECLRCARIPASSEAVLFKPGDPLQRGIGPDLAR
jgi:hypothetical protein